MPSMLLEPVEPTRREIQQAREAARALAEGTLDVSQLPDTAHRLLSQILTEIAEGRALTVVPAQADVTTSKAARLLNVSRPYLTRLLDEGRLPFHSVGTHRRVRLADVLAYRERQEAESEAALAALAAQAQELNLGY